MVALPKKTLIPLLAVLIFTIGSYATSVSITTSTFQGYQGVQFNVTGAFSATSNGFFVAQSPLTASGSCNWTNGGTCQTAVSAGNWYYSITLKLNTVPSSTTTYTVTVLWNTGSGYTQMGQLQVSVTSSAHQNDQMTFIFDTGTGGSTGFNTPSGIVVTVA